MGIQRHRSRSIRPAGCVVERHSSLPRRGIGDSCSLQSMKLWKARRRLRPRRYAGDVFEHLIGRCPLAASRRNAITERFDRPGASVLAGIAGQPPRVALEAD